MLSMTQKYVKLIKIIYTPVFQKIIYARENLTTNNIYKDKFKCLLMKQSVEQR